MSPMQNYPQLSHAAKSEIVVGGESSGNMTEGKKKEPYLVERILLNAQLL